MRQVKTAILVAAMLCFYGAASAPAPHAPSSSVPAEVTAALSAGKSLALIEVVSVKEQDNRAADGDLADVISYKIIKSSGSAPASLRVVKGNPYPQMAGMAAPPEPTGILLPNPLMAGQRYWLVFNESDKKKYPQGVVAWWPEKDAPAALEAAITANKFGKP